jgi:hypothetical protein
MAAANAQPAVRTLEQNLGALRSPSVSKSSLLDICVNCHPISSVVSSPNEMVGTTTMKGMGSDRLSGLTAGTKAATLTISEVSEEQKKATSELYFVDCRVQLTETVGDAARPVASRRFGTRVVTLIFLSFTNGDISIAIPGGGVTLEGGRQWSSEVGIGDAVQVATLSRHDRPD